MEIKIGSIITTEKGDYVVKDMMRVYDPYTFEPVDMYIVNAEDGERAINGKNIIAVNNNHIENIEES